ncbi:MAG: GNAT family N-acetyltransferase [Candidatus Dormibacteria bacterium]
MEQPVVAIRRARPSDARMYSAWTVIPEMRQYQPLVGLTVKAAERMLRRAATTRLAARHGSSARWIVEEDGLAAGWVSIRDIDWFARWATLGYSILPWAQGRGIATRAAELALDEAFLVAELERVEATCDVANEASRRVLEKLGFAREGTLRALASMPDGRHDHHLYSILRPEWLARYQ